MFDPSEKLRGGQNQICPPLCPFYFMW